MNTISATKELTVKVENINNAVVNAMTLEKLKSMFGLIPQVTKDISDMFEKFPHDNIVTQVLYSFVSETIFTYYFNIRRMDLKN